MKIPALIAVVAALALPKLAFARTSTAMLGVYHPEDFGAAGDGAHDDTRSLSAALSSAAASHGIVALACGRTYGISSTLTVARKTGTLTIEGCDSLNGPALRKSASAVGPLLIIRADNVVLRDLYLVGEKGNVGDGLWIRGNGVLLQNVTVEGMGRDGVRVGCDGPGCNSNSWSFLKVYSRHNARNGFRFDDNPGGSRGSVNANAGLCVGCFAQANGAEGFWLGHIADDSFLNVLSEANSAASVYVTSMALNTTFLGGDLSESGRPDVKIDSAESNTRFYGTQLGLVEGASSRAVKAPPRTMAELAAITPSVGDVYSCSDCAFRYDLVIGTGTAPMSFREAGTDHGPR